MVRATLAVGSSPTAKTTELARVVVRFAVGAPVAPLAEIVAPMAPEPFVPEVSAPVKLTTVMDDNTDCEKVAVTVTLVSAAVAKARQISAVPSCVLVRCTRTQVRLPPATPVTVVVVAVPLPEDTKASSSSLEEEVENAAVARVVAVAVPSAKTVWSTASPPGLRTLKRTPLLEIPPAAVTTTLPLVTPLGTWATMLVALQLVTVAGMVFRVTPPLPCEGPRFVPVMVNDEPNAPPAVGATEVMAGAAVTVNVTPALATPPAAVTTTLPVTAPVGTVATMLVGLHDDTVATTVPNLTLPLPCDGPKFAPVITTEVFTAPVTGVRLVMEGAGVPRGSTMVESKLPFSVPSTSSSPLNAVAEVAVRFTPVHR